MIRLRTTARTDSTQAGPVSIAIDRGAGLVMVRPYRRRRTYTLTLATVAEMIVARVVRAEVLEARRDKAKTRPHVRRGLQRRA